MEITFIGIVVIILSIIAFFKDEDWLLGLTMFFSTFVAASAINIYTTTTAIVPFEIPLVLWIIRKFINIIKNRKSITKERIRKLLIENKIFSALLIITVTMILSEIWLLISNIEYTFYDPTYYENRTISFSSSNITQLLRVICFLVFAMLLSIDINDKGKIRKLLKIFATSTIFAVVWGFIQFILYYIKIDYPSYLFNNNPWYSQCVDQVMRGIKRINSIGTEPSVFALNLLAAIPIMLILWLFDREKQSGTFRIINDILIISVITCAVLTTSSTVVVGLISIIGTLLLYLLVNYKKNNKAFKYKKMLKSMMFSALVILVIFIISIGFYEIIKSLNNNVVKEQVSKTDINFLETLKEMTISKLSSGSGRQRAEREVIGFRIYSISPIFGVGFGSFRTFTLFTNVLVNMGILGLLSLLYLIYIVLRTIIANRKKDEKYFLIFLLSIIGMLSAFFVSIPDLIYIYFWSILVLAYKYFTINDTQSSVNKDSLNIGIDGRALNKEKAGIGTYTYEIIKELNELDETNMYYIYSNKKIYIDFELKENFKICESKSKIGTFWLYFLLPKQLRKDEIDIFWGTQHCLPKRNEDTDKINYVLTVHDLAIEKFKNIGSLYNTLIQKLVLKRSCRNADKIISVSEATKRDLIDLFDIKEEKISVIYEGVEQKDIEHTDSVADKQIITKYNLNEDDKFIYFLSTIEPRKNLDTAVKAFEIFKEENNELKFIISGGLGWNYKETLKLIENSKYKDDIIMTGYISKEEKEYFFKNCKAFIYPSLYEGFGLPVLEAMQKGVVVVTSNISSIPEVGGDVPFYLNNVHDEYELAELIKKAVNLSEEDRNIIIERGYNQVKKFTWNKCAKNVLEELKEKTQS